MKNAFGARIVEAPPRELAFARAALKGAKKDLAIRGKVRLRFFEGGKSPDILGYVSPSDPRTICLRTSQPLSQLIITVRHESAHVSQLLCGADDGTPGLGHDGYTKHWEKSLVHEYALGDRIAHLCLLDRIRKHYSERGTPA